MADQFANDYSLPDSLTERIWLTLISQRISRGELREFELADGNWLLNNAWYERNMAGFNEQLKENLSFTPDELKTLFRNRLNLSPEANDDFLDRCLDGGDWYPFSEGRRFVSFHHVDELRICASCGLTEVHHAPENHKRIRNGTAPLFVAKQKHCVRKFMNALTTALFPMQRRMV